MVNHLISLYGYRCQAAPGGYRRQSHRDLPHRASRKGISEHFGYLATPYNRGTATLIEARFWGGDCSTFTGVFDEATYYRWHAMMCHSQDTCLFVVVPDVGCNVATTLALFRRFATRVDEKGVPIALVAKNDLQPFQEGAFVYRNFDYAACRQDHASEFPEDKDIVWWDSNQPWRLTHVRWKEFDCLLIGGDAEWKSDEESLWLIECARKAGKHIHVRRFNMYKRLRHFQLAGAHSVDGKALKFIDDNYPIIQQTLRQPTIFEGCLKRTAHICCSATRSETPPLWRMVFRLNGKSKSHMICHSALLLGTISNSLSLVIFR